MAYDELYHHGILGQKWGQQNGPPYPLKDGAKSLAEKYKAHKVKKKRAKALEKARATKAQKKAEAEEAKRKEEKKKRAEEAWKKADEIKGKVDKLRGYGESAVATYNFVAKVVNSLDISDNTWPKIEEQPKDKASKFIDHLINHGTAKEVYANIDKMSKKNMQDALGRLTTEKKLKEMADE